MYYYDDNIHTGDSGGSDGNADYRDPDVKNPYLLLARILKWSVVRRIRLDKSFVKKIKAVNIYFPPGCADFTKLKLFYNNQIWIPYDTYSDPIQGDGKLIRIVVNQKVKTEDVIEVRYRNLDYSDHAVNINFEMEISEETHTPNSPDVVKMDERKRPYNKTPGYPGAPRKGQVQVVVEKTQGQGMISKGNEHGDGGEFREAYMDGTQSRPNTNENWEDELPDFLKTDRGNYGGNNPRKRKPGRGGD